MKALSPGLKNLVDTLLAVGAFAVAYVVTNVAKFPPEYQSLISTLAGFFGYFISDAQTYVDTGVAPTTNQITAQMEPLWTTTIRGALENEVKTYVKDPAQQAIALAVIASADQKIQQAASAIPPPSPLAEAVASNTPAKPSA